MKTNVPKILHWVWFNFKDPSVESDPPENRFPFQESWIEHHPDWEVKVWKDADARMFLKEHYRWFLPIYDSYPAGIFRADAIRYFLLYHFGGVYTDWDVECHRSIEPLICEPGVEFYAFQEPNPGFSTCNGLMAATPKSSFLKAAIRNLKTAHRAGFTDVIGTTGPGFLTREFMSYSFVEELKAYPTHFLFPAGFQIRNALGDLKVRESLVEEAGSYFIHVWDTSWVWDVEDDRKKKKKFNRRRLTLR